VTWDKKYGYVEQRFESGGVLCAHAYVKGLFLERGRRVSGPAVAAELGYTGAPPPMPEELKLWAEFGSVKKQKA